MKTIYKIQVILTGLLALWVPLKFAETRVDFWMVYLPVLLAPVFAFFTRSKRQDGLTTLEILTGVCLMAGLTYASVNLSPPESSPEAYPPSGGFFIASYLLGLSLIFAARYRNWRPDRTAYFLVLWMTQLLYTQPLDKYPGAVVIPFLAALFALASHIRRMTHVRFFAGFPGGFPVLSLAVFLVTILSLKDWFHQGGTFFTDIILLFTALIMVYLTVRLYFEKPDFFIESVHLFLTTMVVFFVILALWRSVWLVSLFGFITLPKFELWISLIHPNALGVYLAAVIPLIRGMGRNGRRSLIHAMIITAALLLLAATYSRGAWISFSVAIIIGIVVWRCISGNPMFHFLKTRLFLAATLGLIFVMIILAYAAGYRILSTEAWNDRLVLWRAALNSIHSQPVLGLGIGNHDLAAQFFRNPFDPKREMIMEWFGWDRLGRHYHNLFFETGFALGSIGVILLLVSIGMIFHHVYRNRHSMDPVQCYGAVSFLILILSGCLDFVFYYPGLAILAALSAGLVIAVPVKEKTGVTKPAKMGGLIAPSMIAGIILLEILLVVPSVLGNHWFERGRMKEVTEPWWASSAYKKALFYRPWDKEIYQRIIPLHLSMNLPEQAKADMVAMLKYRADDPHALAIMAWASKSPFEQLGNMEKSIRVDPSGLMSGEHYSDLGLIYFLLHNEEKGKIALKTAYLLDPKIPGQLTRSFPRFHGGVFMRPDPLHQYLLARFQARFFEKLHFDEIAVPVESLLHEIELDLIKDTFGPGLMIQRVRLIQAFLYNNQREAGVRLLNRWNISMDELIEREPRLGTYRAGSPEYLVRQARKNLRDGKFHEAEILLQSAMDLGFDSPELRSGFGVLYSHRNEWDKAADEFEKAVEMMPDLAEMHTDLGVACLRLNRFRKAKESFRKALELNPLSVRALHNLGTIMLNEGLYSEAYKLLTKASRLAPEDPMIAGNRILAMAQIEEFRGKLDEELTDYSNRFPEHDIPPVGTNKAPPTPERMETR